MYVQVNIGRNINDEPMDEQVWGDFKEQISRGLQWYSKLGDIVRKPPKVTVHTGLGSWEGTPEESAYLSTFWEAGFDLDGLRNWLKAIAKDYGQDAIALITSSELVTA